MPCRARVSRTRYEFAGRSSGDMRLCAIGARRWNRAGRGRDFRAAARARRARQRGDRVVGRREFYQGGQHALGKGVGVQGRRRNGLRRRSPTLRCPYRRCGRRSGTGRHLRDRAKTAIRSVHSSARTSAGHRDRACLRISSRSQSGRRLRAMTRFTARVSSCGPVAVWRLTSDDALLAVPSQHCHKRSVVIAAGVGPGRALSTR